MNSNGKNQPMPPDLVQQRQQLADALGFLLAQTWLRQYRSASQDAQMPIEACDQQEELPP